MELLQVIKALGDETRIRMLNLLKDGELCVCELEVLLDINQSNASRHLNKLTTAKLVNFEKRALYVYYTLNEKLMNEFPSVRYMIYKEFEKIEKCLKDNEKLHKYKESGKTCEDLKEGKICLD
ncbi:MAG: ArsR/SmtB family transcription factor [Bacillota bacterium]